MSDQDFVERLRIRWDAMGDMANSERAEAATEIEHLRHFLRRSQMELIGQISEIREKLLLLNNTLEERNAEIEDLNHQRERMTDILIRSEHALHGDPLKDGLYAWDNIPELVEKLRKERDEQDEHNARMDHILTRTAIALRGKPPENGLHSWHDLPERVEQLRKERDEARREVCNMKDFHGLPRDYALERGWNCFEETIR